MLHDFRIFNEKKSGTKPSRLGIAGLDELWAKHGGRLEITGPERLALLYHIVSRAVSLPRAGAIVVVDVDGFFDVSRLSCSVDDMDHVYVCSPVDGNITQTAAEVEELLLAGGHESMGRELVGIVVSGGQGGDIMVDWRGWLRVENERGDIPKFDLNVSAEQAFRERNERQTAVESKGWRALSDWGQYRWEND